MKITQNIVIAVCTLLLAACATTPPPAPERKPDEARPQKTARLLWEARSWSEFSEWPGFEIRAGGNALRTSCKSMARRPGWREVCDGLSSVAINDDGALRHYLESRFRPYRLSSSEGGDSGLVTGYYEPMLQGDRKRTERARYPVYAVPDDLLVVELGEVYPELKGMRLRGRLEGRKILPYYSRADIESGKASFTGKELAWVDDPVELFFLQIQGSGRVRLPDGSFVRVGYADQNGYPYKAIGKVLIERGELPASKVSMQSIQAWARENPGKLQELLNSNPSYVFFRELPSNGDGPLGAQGLPLTAGGSIAVDPKQLPLGTPILLATTQPNGSQPLNRLVVAQDTGGAIRGPLRADFFWGYGAEAGRQAGAMKQLGRMWALWPTGLEPPAAEVAP